MAISQTLRNYMDQCGVVFDEVPHAYAFQPARAAQASHLPGRRVAKGVLVRAGDRYMMAVVPSSKQVDFDDLRRRLGREVTLADEDETTQLFGDCDRGALPPVGAAYGLQTLVDDDLFNSDEVFFEGGDHRTLVHVAGGDWRRLQRDADHCAFSV